MEAKPGADGLWSMHLHTKSRYAWAAIVAVASASAVGVLAVTASSQPRSRLLAQLEQRATPAKSTVRRGELKAIVRSRSYRLGLQVSPNTASVPNALSVRLIEGGRPLNGAHVTVTFSMPEMNMWHVFTSRLIPRRDGTYAAVEPVLGMAGTWQLLVHVTRRDLRSTTFTVADPMGS
jgi:hypothetical protein